MTTILGVAEAVLYVHDLQRSVEFYTTVLGLPLTAEFAEACFLQTGRDSTLILFNVEGIKKRESVIPGHGAIGEGHVALAPDDLGAWRRRLERHGVDIEHEQSWSLGSRSIYFRDPDNNSLELITADHYPANWDLNVVGGADG